MALFTYNDFTKDDFELALNNVRDKSLEELVSIMRSALEDAYGEDMKFPSNCCDFSSAFGVFIFNQLGYEVEYWSTRANSINGWCGDHSFLKVDGKIVDFTVDQFGILKPGIISEIDFISNYDDAWCDQARTNGNKYAKFENWQDHRNNFIVMVVYQAIDAFIKLNR